MAKKKVLTVVKIQIPAGQASAGPAGRNRPGSARCGDHGLLQGVQRQDRGQARPDSPGRDLRIRGPVIYLRDQDPSHLVPDPAGGRSWTRPPRNPGREEVGSISWAQVTEIAEAKMPDLNAIDIEGARTAGGGNRPEHGHRGRLIAVRHTTTDRIEGRHPRVVPGQGSTSPRWRKRPNRGSREQAKWVVRASATRMRSRGTTATSRIRVPRHWSWRRRWPVRKFNEGIDLVVRLGVDPRKAEEMIRGTVALPAGTGRDVRVAVFAQGEAAAAAREAGADHVGAEELAAEVEGGMLDFDVAIATPDMMPTVGKLGRSLGPRGLMPNPKSGTVTDDVAKAVARSSRAARWSFAPTGTATSTCPSGRWASRPPT